MKFIKTPLINSNASLTDFSVSDCSKSEIKFKNEENCKKLNKRLVYTLFSEDIFL